MQGAMAALQSLPPWAWGLIIGGGILAAIFVPKLFSSVGSGGSNTTTGQTTDATYGGNIDPYTGVPYAVENAVNPATGLPAYFNIPGVFGTTGNTGGTHPWSGGDIPPQRLPPGSGVGGFGYFNPPTSDPNAPPVPLPPGVMVPGYYDTPGTPGFMHPASALPNPTTNLPNGLNNWPQVGQSIQIARR